MLVVRESPIHGLGLFTNEAIGKGTRVYEYIGEEMTLREFKERYGEYKKASLNTYRMKRLNKIIVAKEEPFKSSNLVNYINESEPNCVLRCRHLVALRDIEAGEELTLRYPPDYCRDYAMKK
jgi:SET domain-containing protein